MCPALAGTAQEILFLHLTVHRGITPWHVFKCVHKERISEEKGTCTLLYSMDPAAGKFPVRDLAGTNTREGGEQKGSARLRPVIVCELFRVINEGYSGLQGLQHTGSAGVLGPV